MIRYDMICMYRCMYVCIYISNQPSVHPPIQSSSHADEDPETWSHPPHKTYSPQNQETHMHQTTRAGREGQNTKDSSVTYVLQLVYHDTAPKQLVCYSWYYSLKYQGNEYNPSARDGTSGQVTNGIYLMPLLQLTHQATLPMEFILYPCYN